MYYDLIKFPLEHENLKWEARESLLDINGVPQLFLRVKLTGTEFPLVAQIPQVWIGKTFAKHVLITDDRRTVRAYFDSLPPEGGEIYFGHLGKAELRFGLFRPSALVRLDRSRLPKNVVLSELR
jgi:hypothetical protein